jgi:hypothetical protein
VRMHGLIVDDLLGARKALGLAIGDSVLDG